MRANCLHARCTKLSSHGYKVFYSNSTLVHCNQHISRILVHNAVGLWDHFFHTVSQNGVLPSCWHATTIVTEGILLIHYRMDEQNKRMFSYIPVACLSVQFSLDVMFIVASSKSFRFLVYMPA